MVPVKMLTYKSRVRLWRAWLYDYRRSFIVPILVLGFVAVSVAINVHRYMYGRYQYMFVICGPAIIVAKCCSAIAEVCFGLILLPVSRGPVTWLRSTWMRNIIDFDEAINFHAWLGAIGIVAALCHGSAATASYLRVAADTTNTSVHDHYDIQRMLGSWNYISGWVLVVLALISFPFALRWPRQAPWLKSTRLGKILNNTSYFWVTHHILILVFIPVLIMHSVRFTPRFHYSSLERIQTTKLTYYLMMPLLLYMIQRVYRMARASHLALVLDAHVVGGDVLELKVIKPRKFHYIPGQFMYVCCPNVSSFEWHPFTITSAPQDDYVSVHIKRAGDWTGALHDLFQQGNSLWRDNTLFTRKPLECTSQPVPANDALALPPGSHGSPGDAGSHTTQHQMQLVELPPDGSTPYNHAASLRRTLSNINRIGNNPAAAAGLSAGKAASSDGLRSRRNSLQGPAGFQGIVAGSRRLSATDANTSAAQNGGAMTAIRSASRQVTVLHMHATGVITGAWDPSAVDQLAYAHEQLQAAVEKAAQAAQCSHQWPDLATAPSTASSAGLTWAASAQPESIQEDHISDNLGDKNTAAAATSTVIATSISGQRAMLGRANDNNCGATDAAAGAVVTVSITTPCVDSLTTGNAAASAGKAMGTAKGGQELEVLSQEGAAVSVPPLLYIDGPFGAPTQDFKHYKVVVLVGTGIGITPMASVLRSLMHHLYDARCEGCGLLNRRLCRVRQSKVYVHWVSRNTDGMAWFEKLLVSICELDVDHVFKLNVHLTGVKAPGGVPSRSVKPAHMVGGSGGGVCLTVGAAAAAAVGRAVKPLQEVVYAYGRPDMPASLSQVHAAHAGETVGVFYCGPRALGEQMEKACRTLNIASEAAWEEMMDEEGGWIGKRPCRLQYHEEIF